MEQVELMKLKNWRYIEPNEIVIEFDNCKDTDLAVQETANNLLQNNFSFEIWKAKGQRSCHIHIKNFNESLTKEYKENFIKKYVPEPFTNKADFSLCIKHPIAEENMTHYKYGTIKKLLGKWNEHMENMTEQSLFDIKKEKITFKEITGITSQIVSKVSILDVASSYGFDVSHSRAYCLFHKGTNPTSLSFNRAKGTFKCFSCGINGNIIDFVKECKKRGMKKNGQRN